VAKKVEKRNNKTIVMTTKINFLYKSFEVNFKEEPTEDKKEEAKQVIDNLYHGIVFSKKAFLKKTNDFTIERHESK
jgi:hypothetical protein